MIFVYEIQNKTGKRKSRLSKSYHCLDHDSLLVVIRTYQVPDNLGYEKFKQLNKDERQKFALQLTKVDSEKTKSVRFKKIDGGNYGG